MSPGGQERGKEGDFQIGCFTDGNHTDPELCQSDREGVTIVMHDAEAGGVEIDAGAAGGMEGVGPALVCSQAEAQVMQEVAGRDLGQQGGVGGVQVQLVRPQLPLPQHVECQWDLHACMQVSEPASGLCQPVDAYQSKLPTAAKFRDLESTAEPVRWMPCSMLHDGCMLMWGFAMLHMVGPWSLHTKSNVQCWVIVHLD